MNFNKQLISSVLESMYSQDLPKVVISYEEEGKNWTVWCNQFFNPEKFILTLNFRNEPNPLMGNVLEIREWTSWNNAISQINEFVKDVHDRWNESWK